MLKNLLPVRVADVAAAIMGCCRCLCNRQGLAVAAARRERIMVFRKIFDSLLQDLFGEGYVDQLLYTNSCL
jgi:hypothetical protein